ncbi:MAG: TadE/TadG family type IV pilus assembly protein [Kineosporiaceae bacterium]
MGGGGTAADAGVQRGRVRGHRALTRGQDGSAAVDFALVSVLLTLVFLGVVQVALALHVRTTLTDAAGEGARLGALAGRQPGEGAVRTRDLAGAALTPAHAEDVSVATTPVPGGEVVVVTVRAPLPVLGLLGPRSLEVRGRALREGA